MGGYTTGLACTPEEEETIHSKRTNMRRKGTQMRPLVSWRGNNSITHRDYPGPAGWTHDMRAPCQWCEFNLCKTITLDDVREKLRDECALCTARQVWDRHESGEVPTVAEDENYDYQYSFDGLL